MIKNTTSIEELVNKLPSAVKYLSEKGINCIACGEPIWGTIEEAAVEKGFEKDDIEIFVRDLNRLLDQLDK
jgi:DNA-binding MarR family transcriptional regulator